MCLYTYSTEPAIRSVSLDILPGSKVAFCGRTGRYAESYAQLAQACTMLTVISKLVESRLSCKPFYALQIFKPVVF